MSTPTFHPGEGSASPPSVANTMAQMGETLLGDSSDVSSTIDKNENMSDHDFQVVDDGQPTFATATEDIDVHIHDNASNLKIPEDSSPNDSSRPKPIKELLLKKELTQEEKDRKEFYRMMTSSAPSSRATNITRKVQTINRPPSLNLSEEEIVSIADSLIKGKKVVLKDPIAVAGVIKELDSRRLLALSQSEYLKSKKIGDIIESLKVTLYQSDCDILFKENLDNLTAKHKEAVDALEEAKAEWKKRHADFIDECKNEAADLQTKFENEQADLDAKWMDPATQRKFTKRSPFLLQQKAVEKYMVLAGELEAAEQTKKINQQNEKLEVQQKYQNMQGSYEFSRKQLMENQNAELEQMKNEQENKYKQMLAKEQMEIEIAKKRVAFAQKNLDDQNNLEKFIAKKFRKTNGLLPLSVLNISDDLPPLSRGKGLNRAEANKQTAKPTPLQLPPLKMKPTKTQKIVISLK
ncbi:hypothetical protein TRFO_06284 [Tritrichomonas foetus]|uniref:Uncharacterized protein n=1 Tax=Tritrichomonas foetus TaxID=1144522 RepID=A0A1J4JZ07_9EUKA|nr:hypothetical protein TRFO_06284 [Tritrichomonas foetus]|eukprot:OHT04407.1 hypothetical protein TRFO_06284 [Tritrichomonas foetus]